MKILEVNKFYNTKRGGDKHFLDVIELLEKSTNKVAAFSMKQRGDDYSVWEKYFLSPVGYSNKFTLWQKLKGAGRMFYSPEAHKKIRKILNDFKPDIVHIHNIYHQMDPTILFEIKKQGIPIVMTVHDFKIINPNHSMMLNGRAYDRCKNGKYYQCFIDRAIKNSYSKSFLGMIEAYWHSFLKTYDNVDIFIAPSEFVKKRLIDWGVSESKIKVVAHFISKSIDSQENQKKIEQKERYALYVGKISKEKGIDLLTNIFKKDLAVKLYLAGEVAEDFEVLRNKNIVNLGILNKEEVKNFMINSEFVISATKLPETFGLIALEAISSGVPFVGFNTGAFDEIIDSNVGFLANTKQQLQKIVLHLSNNEIFFEKKAILEKANSFSQEKYLQKMEKIFKFLKINKENNN
jgi:glycosyltransferase involved in cell wall biosynthesis